MNVLAYLIPLWNIRVEITFAIEFAKVGKRTADGGANAQDMTDCLPVDDGQSARVRHTDWTYIYIRFDVVRVVRRVTEHFRPCMELGMDLEANGGAIHVERVP